MPSFWIHAAAVVVSFAGWAYARGNPKQRKTLEVAELAFMFPSLLAYVAMGYFMPPIDHGMTIYLAPTMGLFARAIFVPSTPRRSLMLAMSVAVPAIVTGHLVVQNGPDYYHETFMRMARHDDPASFVWMNTVFVMAWWFGTISMTTGASKVIYGLRQEVRDAKRLGQYNLEEKLGEGGMGEVFRASHALLQRPTAVKLLPDDKVGEQSIARFEREVRLTARLTHPNTITIFDFGRTPDDVFYYAMELLDGANLETIVERTGPLTPARAVHFLTQICGALAEAHGIGLIHRDIKPANVMICEQGGVPDTVKVLDFGLVKNLDQTDSASLTQANVVTGTPQYMPPEALTRPDEVDARSDLYAVGAVAFFLLTGEPLFEGNTVVEICGHHLHTAPRRVSELVEVPPALDDIVLGCVAKDPDERPQSAHELIGRLDALELTWTRAQAAAWWEKHGEAVGVRELGLREAGNA